MLHSLNGLVGYTIKATDKPAGHIADLYVEDVTWNVRHIAVADAGGVGIQMASVEPSQVSGVDSASQSVSVGRSQADIAGGPDVTLDPPVSHHVNRENDPHLRSIKEITGYAVQASDGAVGTLEDFLMDADGWKIQAVVIADQSGTRRLVAPGLVDRLDFDSKTAHVEFDSDHFAKSPACDPASPIQSIEDVKMPGRTTF